MDYGRCKHCGEQIHQSGMRWYHTYTQVWWCQQTTATPDNLTASQPQEHTHA